MSFWVTHGTTASGVVGNFYRPQRSCESYVFTGVCLSTGVGWGCLPQCMLGYHPREQTPPGRRHPLGADTPPPRSRHHPPPPRYGHCCGRYASYWNAFLFILYLFIDRSYCSMSVPNENADDVSYLFSSCVQKNNNEEASVWIGFSHQKCFLKRLFRLLCVEK